MREKLSEQGISKPTAVQEEAFEPILGGKDVLAQSMTGSGKTLAFALPLALRLLQSGSKSRQPRVLILTPTRELATQVCDVFKTTLSPLGLRLLSIIGGTSYTRQEMALSRGIDIVVGTPGRVVDLIKRGTLKMDTMECFVLDEVDQMLDFGFADDLTEVRKAFPKKAQTLFFSATISDFIARLANQMLEDPHKIRIASTNNSPSTIKHGYLFVKAGHRLAALVNALMYYDPAQSIIFCETKKECAEVTASLIKRGFNASQLNSDLGQQERQATLDRFRTGELRYLVATNVAARGIDIQDLPLVVNFGVPREIESYTHRSGRTGRAGASGIAWSIVTPKEIRTFVQLMRQLKINPELIAIPDRIEILKRVAEREVQSLLKPIGNEIKKLNDVVDKTLEAVPAEAARSILAGFLSQRLSNLEIFDSNEIRCVGELNIQSGPRRHHNGPPRDRGYHRREQPPRRPSRYPVPERG